MHDLLDDLAPEVDVDTAWDEVRAKLARPRTGLTARVLAVAAAFALVAGAVVLATRGGTGGDDEAPVIQGGSDEQGAVSVDLRGEWIRAVAPLAPEADEVLAVSTIPLTANASGNCPDLPSQALDDFVRTATARDAFVWVARSTASSTAPPLDDLELPIRPADDDRVAECIPITGGFAPPIAFTRGHYERDGEVLEVLVALGLGDSTAGANSTRDEVQALLDSIHVHPERSTHRSVDRTLLVEYPSSWRVGDGAGGTVVVSTDAIPAEPDRCPDGQRCRFDPCTGWPLTALEQMEDDDVVLWFDVISAAAIDFATPREPRDELPTAQPIGQGCDAARPVAYRLTPAPGGRAIVVNAAIGPDADESVREKALAVVNSVAHEPLRVHEQVPEVAVAQPGGWLRENGVLSGGPGGTTNPWPSFALGSYPLLRNVPDAPCDQLPVTSLERLGRRDGLVWVVEPPAGATPSEGLDDRVEVPGPVVEGDTADCFLRDGNFRLDAAWVERDGQTLLVGAATGLLADDARLAEVRAMVDSIVAGVGVDPEVTVEPPSGWEAAGQLTASPPDAYELQVLAAGTLALRPDTEDVGCDHWPVRASNDMGPDDALVWLVRYQDPEPNLDEVAPFARFTELPGSWVRTCPAVARRAYFADFQVGGVPYRVHVLLGEDAGPQVRREALEVLNTLTFP